QPSCSLRPTWWPRTPTLGSAPASNSHRRAVTPTRVRTSSTPPTSIAPSAEPPFSNVLLPRAGQGSRLRGGGRYGTKRARRAGHRGRVLDARRCRYVSESAVGVEERRHAHDRPGRGARCA